jgi:hypothetical protein
LVINSSQNLSYNVVYFRKLTTDICPIWYKEKHTNISIRYPDLIGGRSGSAVTVTISVCVSVKGVVS